METPSDTSDTSGNPGTSDQIIRSLHEKFHTIANQNRTILSLLAMMGQQTMPDGVPDSTQIQSALRKIVDQHHHSIDEYIIYIVKHLVA